MAFRVLAHRCGSGVACVLPFASEIAESGRGRSIWHEMSGIPKAIEAIARQKPRSPSSARPKLTERRAISTVLCHFSAILLQILAKRTRCLPDGGLAGAGRFYR